MFEVSFALTLSLSKILHKEDQRDDVLFSAMVTGLVRNIWLFLHNTSTVVYQVSGCCFDGIVCAFHLYSRFFISHYLKEMYSYINSISLLYVFKEQG